MDLSPAPEPKIEPYVVHGASLFSTSDDDMNGCLDDGEMFHFLHAVRQVLTWATSKRSAACCDPTRDEQTCVNRSAAAAAVACMYGEDIAEFAGV